LSNKNDGKVSPPIAAPQKTVTAACAIFKVTFGDMAKNAKTPKPT
jgi:hypothetical protein